MSSTAGPAIAGGHTPVLYQHVLSALQPSAGGLYIDGTLGAGGHAAGILQASAPDGRLLGLDRDPEALKIAKDRLAEFEDRVRLQHANFTELGDHASALGSSMQLEDRQRGFSFRLEGPLDMRFDTTQGMSAADLVNGLPQKELADLISRFGEEPLARKVAKAIVAARPLNTTIELADVVASVAWRRRSRIHPATRTFQALRIVVNDELLSLETGLQRALDLLAPGGKIAVIAFHSLEDRIVKRYFQQESKDCICPPDRLVCTCGHRARLKVRTRRPIRPEESEIQLNPRARSARLRVAERLEMA
jgi:16S rRNA (cytosine1402-N4)-methyltransferase